MFSAREIINDLSYSDSNTQVVDSLPEKFSFNNLTILLSSSQRYFYLKENQTLKLFLTILHRLISSSSIPRKSSSTIPDAPPLPADIDHQQPIATLSPSETNNNNEEPFSLRDLFDETIPTILTNTSTIQPDNLSFIIIQ